MDISRTLIHPSSEARITLSDVHQSTSSIRKVTFLPLLKLLTIWTFKSEFDCHFHKEKKDVNHSGLNSQGKTAPVAKVQFTFKTEQSLAVYLPHADCILKVPKIVITLKICWAITFKTEILWKKNFKGRKLLISLTNPLHSFHFWIRRKKNIHSSCGQQLHLQCTHVELGLPL